MKILSLGAGVQSTTVLLMSCRGILPKVDHAVFADTGWEPYAVYDHLDWLKDESEIHGIPVSIVDGGDLRADGINSKMRGTKANDERWMSLPVYSLDADGNDGQIRRQCTSEYKIQPIEKWLRREILGLKPRQRVPKGTMIEHWFGISSDEAGRMREPHNAWQTYHYPLCNVPVEYMGKAWTRGSCEAWLKREYPDRDVPRSACVGCPYHSNAEWARIQADPVQWADVVEFDKAIRNCGGMRGQVFLHRDCKPLDEIDFRSKHDKNGQASLWDCEIEGMCGV